MAQQPAVVIIARHGPRLDAADHSWHLSTPTPYDPPLTYGGWNQCRSLGVRIASLLDAREKVADDAVSEASGVDGVTAHDFAQGEGGVQAHNGRKRKRKHKVVIHTSPFLRCVQTSVAIAAGMAQFHPAGTGVDTSSSRPSMSRTRTPNTLHSASPRLRAMEVLGSPNLAPISEPRQDLAHTIARRVLSEHKRHRKCKLRVDAFLGEWLNPQYFEHITPPPPSAMMVATAKAELVQNDPVDIFTPSILSTKSSHSSLWGGGTAAAKRTDSKDSALEEWDDVHAQLPAPAARKDRTSSMSSLGSNDNESGRRSPLHHAHHTRVQDFASTVPKPETTIYVPPTPHYAVSGSDQIPRGYVTHARQACVDVDYQWDSSRPPQDWGDGGEYGEEWSAMHKRFRKGLNHLVDWYGRHGADDRGEDALGFEQAEQNKVHEMEAGHEDEQEEDLVVVLVTHGAGSNALIGALTGQPVLLDVGMASLTMAVRRDDAPHNSLANGYGHGHAKRGSTLDSALALQYEMKLISSSEHLRPGADPRRGSSATRQQQMDPRGGSGSSVVPRYTSRRTTGSGSGLGTHFGNGNANGNGSGSEAPYGPVRSRSSTSSALGSVLRPLGQNAHQTTNTTNTNTNANTNTSSVSALPRNLGLGGIARSNTSPIVSQRSGAGGLWTPPTSRTPVSSQAQEQEKKEKGVSFGVLDYGVEGASSGSETETETERENSRSMGINAPTTASEEDVKAPASASAPAPAPPSHDNATATALNGSLAHSSLPSAPDIQQPKVPTQSAVPSKPSQALS